MAKAKVTAKGQVTIPKEVRTALSIREGDAVVFTVEDDRAVLRPVRKKAVKELYGALPATRPYPGVEATRREVRRKRARRFQKGVR